MAFYATIAAQHGAPRLKPPFNLAARKRAGFTQAEIDALPLPSVTCAHRKAAL
jgi:uncharacterized ferritin-like protein (DUF455 family)